MTYPARTLTLTALTVAALLAVPPIADARAVERAAPLVVRVDPAQPGPTVPKSFLGFSLEFPELTAYAGPAQSPNELFIRLLGTLSAYGNGPPSVRIGGNSTDQSWWNPAGAPRPPNVFNDLTHDWVASLARLAQRTGIPVTIGVNLALNDPGNARALALAVAAALPAGALQALEIGNEPDLFARPRSFYVGRHLVRRPQHRPAYSFEQYAAELGPYLDAFAPDARLLSAGGFASAAWDGLAVDLVNRARGRIGMLSAHAYRLATCGAERRRPRERLISDLLAGRRAPTRVRALIGVASGHGLPVRVSEANSAVCGGVSGVSDAFASALWGVNALFAYFQAGASGVNMHTWNGAFYAPLEFRTQAGRPVAIVHPLYYGMLLFARATAHRARLLPVVSFPKRRRMRSWATANVGGTVRVLVINASPDLARRARVQIPGFAAVASLERLRGPSLGARGGVTLAGKSYGGVSADGALHGRHEGASVRPRAGLYAFDAPPASATLLTVHP